MTILYIQIGKSLEHCPMTCLGLAPIEHNRLNNPYDSFSRKENYNFTTSTDVRNNGGNYTNE